MRISEPVRDREHDAGARALLVGAERVFVAEPFVAGDRGEEPGLERALISVF